MNKTRTWTLALLAGLLGAGDWFLAPLPADDNPASKPALTVGNAAISAALREIEVDGKKESHLFLDLKGEGAGTLKVRLSGTPFNPMSRVMPMPKTLWEKDLAVDSAKSKSIDLGALPDGNGNVLFTLAASADGKTYISLLNTGMKLLPNPQPRLNRVEM